MSESRALSQWEIDALLNQIPEGGTSEDVPEGTAPPVVSQVERPFARVIKTYDFRRPDKFSKEQWHTLQSMHETFARLTGAQFSSHLRTLVTVRLSSIDQGLYEEWQSQVPSQTACYVLSMEPLSGNIVVEFNHDVAAEVIDRLLGGNGLLLDRGRDLSEIELAMLRFFSRAMSAALAETWAAIVPVQPELQELGMDAGLIQIAGPNDVVITAFFEVNLGNHLGAMSICIPYTVIEPIASKLSAQVWHLSGGQRHQSARNRRIMETLLGDASMDVSVQLGSTDLPVRSALEMREGDTLMLDGRANQPLLLLVGGIPRFQCRPGLVGNRIAARVTEVIEQRSFDFDEGEELFDVTGVESTDAPVPITAAISQRNATPEPADAPPEQDAIDGETAELSPQGLNPAGLNPVDMDREAASA